MRGGHRLRVELLWAAPGQTTPLLRVWRARLWHFSPWDINWPFNDPSSGSGPMSPAPCETVAPATPDPSPPSGCGSDTGDDTVEDPACEVGSIIECENQVLLEDLPVAGTDFSLVYRSDRVPGRSGRRRVKLPVFDGTTPSVNLKRVELTVNVAGQRRTETRQAASGPPETYAFTWDGLDGFGRPWQGSAVLRAEVTYAYAVTYAKPDPQVNRIEPTARPPWLEAFLLPSFGRPGVPWEVGNFDRGNMELERTTSWTQTIRQWNDGLMGLGGWRLDVHHAYDVRGGLVHRGGGDTFAAAGAPVGERTGRAIAHRTATVDNSPDPCCQVRECNTVEMCLGSGAWGIRCQPNRRL